MRFNDIDEANKRINYLEKEIEKVIADKEILRSQAKDARKQKRDLIKKIKEETGVDFNNIECQMECSNASQEKMELQYPTIDNNVPSYNLFEGKMNLVTVVVCVHNCLNDVQECLVSLWNNRTFPYQIIIVDDGSEFDTNEYLSKYSQMTNSVLLRNEVAKGYTISANMGIRKSNADYIVLLNSDTIVTEGWIEKLLNCMWSDTYVGIVSPLSNAASWQSVPKVHDYVTGDWKINQLESGIGLELMSQTIESCSQRLYPEVEVINGFCMMISRELINCIGILDEENFPRGYGEEVDYCIRAKQHGFKIKVADDTYIFHEKSKSFTHQTRKELGKKSKVILRDKHGDDLYNELSKKMENNIKLISVRKHVNRHLYDLSNMSIMKKKIAFLLTARGGSGGANSVCQEVLGMRKLGVQVYIINSSNYKDCFDKFYPELAEYVLYFDKKSKESLLKIAAEFDVIVGTIFTTIDKLKIISEEISNIKMGYYIQDYEPLFFEKDEIYYEQAKQSYTQINGMCEFAKTDWICNQVLNNHKKKVYRVIPGIDRKIYNAYIIQEKEIPKKIIIAAMIRPSTKRRNAEGTMRILKRLDENFGSKIEIEIFGCNDDELKSMGEFNSFRYHNNGVINRKNVAELLLKAHIFLDMSFYQAFGRTGLEAMCMGCVSVLPLEGGTDQYAIDGKNAILVDTLNEEIVYKKISYLLKHKNKIRELQKNALNTGREYSVLKASVSELVALNNIYIDDFLFPEQTIRNLQNELFEKNYEIQNQNLVIDKMKKNEKELKKILKQREEEIDKITQRANLYLEWYKNIEEASFWKLTKPLRKISDFLKK